MLYGIGETVVSFRFSGCYNIFRSSIQIKSHGQKILRRQEAGDNVFLELDMADAMAKVPNSVPVRLGGKGSLVPSIASETDDETASLVSDVSWNETCGSKKAFTGSARSMLSGTKERNEATTYTHTFQQPLPSLSMSEATVVLALCELAEPVKIRRRIAATASKYATALPFEVAI